MSINKIDWNMHIYISASPLAFGVRAKKEEKRQKVQKWEKMKQTNILNAIK